MEKKISMRLFNMKGEIMREPAVPRHSKDSANTVGRRGKRKNVPGGQETAQTDRRKETGAGLETRIKKPAEIESAGMMGFIVQSYKYFTGMILSAPFKVMR